MIIFTTDLASQALALEIGNFAGAQALVLIAVFQAAVVFASLLCRGVCLCRLQRVCCGLQLAIDHVEAAAVGPAQRIGQAELVSAQPELPAQGKEQKAQRSAQGTRGKHGRSHVGGAYWLAEACTMAACGWYTARSST